MSDSLQPRGTQHARLLCPSLSPRGGLNSSIESVMPSNHLCQQRHPLSSLLSCPQSFPVSETVLCSRWPKFWSFNINPSSEFSGLIFFRIDWFDLLAVHGTLKSLLQHHNSKASILGDSAFFMVQLQHSYMMTRKT